MPKYRKTSVRFPSISVKISYPHPEHGFEAGAVRCIEDDVARIDLPPDLAKDTTLIHLYRNRRLGLDRFQTFQPEL